MAKIEEIDYDGIIRKANKIASHADAMQKDIKSAFKEIDNMRTNWFGNSYDNFINTVNMSVILLNKLFETSVSDIPHEIAAKAKSYASSNQATVSAGFNERTAVILSDISKTNKGSKIRFRSSEVSSNQSTIKSKFKNAKSAAQDALTTSNSLGDDWQSISGNTNISELKTAFKKVQSIIEALSDALDSQISAQKSTIDTLETAASTVEATANIVEGAVDTTVNAATSAVNKIQQSAADTWRNLTGKN